jgi:phosphoglucosamine mutase
MLGSMTDAPMLRPTFGTDGLRGRAGEPPLDPATLRRVAAAIGVWVQGNGGEQPRVLTGNDGRESAAWIEAALAAGLAAAQASVVDAGLVTTPALAWLARSQRFDAAVMISASHNPAEDNGIKVFDGAGRKLPAAAERTIEDLSLELDPPAHRPRPRRQHELVAKYEAHLAGCFPDLDLAGLVLAVDAANGGASELAPAVLRRFGATVVPFACAPDGRNINAGVGAVHPQAFAAEVVRSGAALGLCLDGDGDRSLFVDETGVVRDGDEVLALLAPALQRDGALPGGLVVATEMSNLGLDAALRAHGIAVRRTQVGDKHVVEAMRATGAALGGEQSGHIVFAGDGAWTGDGLFTALKLLALVPRPPGGYAAAFAGFTRWPQVLRNVTVARKPDLATLPQVQAVRAEVERELGADGRVLLRYSGTEPKCRVMVEGRDAAAVQTHAERLAAAIRAALA